MKVIREFAVSRPKVSVRIDASLSEHHRKSLRDGFLDLAIMRQPLGIETGKVLAKNQLVWIADAGLDLDNELSISLAHISGPCQYFRAATTTIEAAGDHWRSVYSCSTLEGVRAGVCSGMGVGVIPVEDCTDLTLIREHHRLPKLPEFSVAIEMAIIDPPVIVRVLAEKLKEVL
ncbi:LysR substrate-binding domain-containing protein [Granulosicoccus antarcticus]|uniref:LysR substrate-binding domain-containing protein n=1 Tax=Granulosicoccus antarcticus IMCC3135 TaxID=1192854 RepID=A0A2Z2NPQ0_9GAMM|nr:LysR substrate-binding domain-containing protein [Granulosicoccus antarcticus]ASJ73402.1 hypothetical protein IMCC3135_16600 [Granulosicoccus antarcticus IMCC3135]